MSITLAERPPIQTDIILDQSFQTAGEHFARLTLDQRLAWAHEKYGGGLVMTSSFGVQSILLLDAVKKSGLDIPVISIDIHDEKYDAQRAYRDLLQRELGFDLRVFFAKDDGDKVRTMDQALAQLGATAQLSGIRASQTTARQSKDFIQTNARNGLVEINPLLDWADMKADYYIESFQAALRHPDYQTGVQSKGGAVLAVGQQKTECGLHI